MIEGIDIKEVWDYRLSRAVPGISRASGTWVVEIWSKNNEDYAPGGTPAVPLEIFDTGIPTEEGDEWDTEKVSVCYEWLLAVRDKYSLPNIEKLKPLAAKANQLQRELGEIQAGMSSLEAALSPDAILKKLEMGKFKAVLPEESA